ncbi:MAG: PAS domain S-box protein [Vicinamibacterales bacterium]
MPAPGSVDQNRVPDNTALEQRIFDLERAAAAREQAEGTYATLFSTLHTGVVVTDEVGRIIDANPAAEQILGLSRSETLERTFDAPEWAFLRSDGTPMPADEYASVRAIRGQQAVDGVEMGIRRPDGTLRWSLTSASPILVEGLGVCVTFADITERKHAEAALTRERALLAEGEALAHCGTWEYSAETGETTWSEEERRIYGLSPQSASPGYDELIARHVHPDDAAVIRERFHTARRNSAVFESEHRIVRPDGSVRVIQDRAVPHLDPGGRLLNYTGASLDITERRSVEQALRQSEERFRAFYDIGLVGLTVTSPDKGWVLINDRLCEMLEYEQDALRTMTWVDLTHRDDLAEDVAQFQRMLDGEIDGYEMEKRFIARSGTVVSTNLVVRCVRRPDGSMDYCLALVEDITQRKRAEAERAALETELQQTRKLESIGRLAGGVAHEFNNMLAVILGYSELALRRVDPAQPLHADLEEIRVAATRSADVTRQLLAFARKQFIAARLLDLNESVAGAITMLRPLIGEHIQVTWQPAAGLWPIMADSTQITQVLTNLFTNARDAIADTGQVNVTTEFATIDAAYCAAHSEAVPGQYACLVVSDDGGGMAPETLSRAFEPFYTTKEVGGGTGLGLPSVEGIVLQHGGFISASSTLGVGTTFRLYFPRHLDSTSQATLPATGGLPKGGGETILVVEDEPALLALTAKQLIRLGYAVIPARAPSEALRLARGHTGTIDLLLTDLVLPEMTGAKLAERIVALRPHVRRLFMSGYPPDAGPEGGRPPDAPLLQKPFTFSNLSTSIRQALETGPR